jgi:alkanesulfonate monooxygenase SsuD/methylene tetrahydromethanopterin reductase-like flavin-dependent oxidoreductase (luciferase family)
MTRALIDAPTDTAAPRPRDYGHDLEFGVFIEPAARSADEVVALSALAEEAGYDLVTFNDHPYSPRALDSLTLMSFVAARTGRVRLAANVLSLPLRPPAVLARAVVSLDILSHGRAELGIGAGIAWDAIETMGGRRLDPGDSIEALEEGIHVIRELFDAAEQGRRMVRGQVLPAGGRPARAGAGARHQALPQLWSW